MVTVPTVESIAGDKLTAFAPNTTGIPLGRGRETEIIKQLFDIGHLFDEAGDTEEIYSSFHAFVVQEIKYRELDTTKENVLWDIIETGKLIAVGAKLKASDQPERNNYDLLMKGLKAFESFLIEGHFRLLAANILSENKSQLEKYAGQSIVNLDITNVKWNALNKLKRMPAAYFYWYKALTLLHLVK
jgi:hypothetical protein